MRYKVYTAINILGLAVGITCTVLIMLFVRSEWSFDRFHSKSSRLYRMWQQEKYEGETFKNSMTPYPLGPALQQHIPEVESVCRVYNFQPVVKVDGRSFTEGVCMVDSPFFSMFDFSMISGSKVHPFPNSRSVLLTEETAEKFFGKEPPIGKQIELKLGETMVPFTVSGVMRSAPIASSIQYRMLISYANDDQLFSKRAMNNWFNVVSETYVMLKQNADVAAAERKLPAMVKAQLGADYKEGAYAPHFQPITDIHLNTEIPAGIQPTSNPKYAYILFSIGLLILLVACINFITLSVGRSVTRAMEVGVRKTLGAGKGQLVRQFWGEAVLLTMLSFGLALLLSLVLLKPFRTLVGRELQLSFDLTFVWFSLLLLGVIALLSGLYPALILSKYKPVAVLKGKIAVNTQGGWLRKSLIVGQFVASIAMIVCTMVIQAQMKYMETKELGYNKENLVVVPVGSMNAENRNKAAVFQQKLSQSPVVKGTSLNVYSLAENAWLTLGFTDEKKTYRNFQYNSVDAAFLPLMKISLLKGRNFQETNQADLTQSAIVNEAYVKSFGLKEPIGQKLPGPYPQTIIGVVKDFNYQSLHNPVLPLVLTQKADSIVRGSENITYDISPMERVTIRLEGNIATGLNEIKKAWSESGIEREFEFSFVDLKLKDQYFAEQRTAKIVEVASILSIFIACLGLFGLVTLAVARRTKEIGVRKVLGATVLDITTLLSREFVLLILISAAIAFPIALWFTTDWLRDFAYRVSIGWWLYPIAGLVALLVAVLTISVQAVKAALANPVKNLRTE